MPDNILKNLVTILLLIMHATTNAKVEVLPENHQCIHEVLKSCFPSHSLEKINIKPLKGGLSVAQLYEIEIDGKSYVLRILQSLGLNDQDSLELFCLKEAAKKGLSPQIIYISPDSRTVLMDFVTSETLSIVQANLPENIFNIARTIYETHQITGHDSEGESLISKSQRCAPALLITNLAPKGQIEHACELINLYSQALGNYDNTKVRVHGDLNPRNIFLLDGNVLFIDWAETTMEDPFYDLAYFSLKANYSRINENLLLEGYLGRAPIENEYERFQLHKKIHHAFWSLTDLYLANVQLKKHPEQQIDPNKLLREWKFYQGLFADSRDELSAQFFYDLSRLNYQLAQ